MPKFVEILVDLADKTIALNVVEINEKPIIRKWRDQLINSVNDLMNIFAAHGALQRHADRQVAFDPDGPTHLKNALMAAFLISGCAFKSPIVERLQREANHARAAYATKGKKEKSKIINDTIQDICGPALQKKSKLTDNALADKHQDEINKFLAEKGVRTLKPDAIRKRLNKLRMNGRLSD
jgi:hypothetical protein